MWRLQPSSGSFLGSLFGNLLNPKTSQQQPTRSNSSAAAAAATTTTTNTNQEFQSGSQRFWTRFREFLEFYFPKASADELQKKFEEVSKIYNMLQSLVASHIMLHSWTRSIQEVWKWWIWKKWKNLRGTYVKTTSKKVQKTRIPRPTPRWRARSVAAGQ